MRIWLIRVGEPLPMDRTADRKHRTGMLADALLKQGHEVVWWASTFNHRMKEYRAHEDTLVRVGPKFSLRLLHGRPYTRNISLARMRNLHTLGAKFQKFSEEAEKPDVICCCFPPPSLGAAATEFGRRHQIPVVIDYRDLWPDILIDLAPRWARGLARLALRRMVRDTKKSFKQAAAITGITPCFVEKALDRAGRQAGRFDRAFPLASPNQPLDPKARDRARHFWEGQGFDLADPGFVVCFFGTISVRLEVETLVRAARLVEAAGSRMKFVICGTGENEAKCKALAAGGRNILFPGWVGGAEIRSLMEIASVGVLPYPSTTDFSASIPNKVIEYFAGGLPVLSSVQGYLRGFLDRNQCGRTYANGSAEELAAVLRELQDDRSQLARLSRRASAVYQEMAAYLVDVARQGARDAGALPEEASRQRRAA